jgi:hypothetical protein
MMTLGAMLTWASSALFFSGVVITLLVVIGGALAGYICYQPAAACSGCTISEERVKTSLKSTELSSAPPRAGLWPGPKLFLDKHVYQLRKVRAIVLTLNVQLLGGSIIFFQSLSVLGYCLFPLDVSALVCMANKSKLFRSLVVFFSLAWSYWAAYREHRCGPQPEGPGCVSQFCSSILLLVSLC